MKQPLSPHAIGGSPKEVPPPLEYILTMNNFPQWASRVVRFPQGGALVHVTGKIGSGKTTFFDAIAFVLTGMVRPSMNVLGGVAAHGGRAPDVTLATSDGLWSICRAKKRNGLTVDDKDIGRKLSDDVAQTWINDRFGVSDHMLYVATYMPHRRIRSGLLCMTASARREVLQNHYADGLDMARRQDAQARFLATLTHAAADLGSGLQSLRLVSPVTSVGRQWVEQTVLPRMAPSSSAIQKVVQSHGVAAERDQQQRKGVRDPIETAFVASPAVVAETLKEDTPHWWAGESQNWQTEGGFWTLPPTLYSSIVASAFGPDCPATLLQSESAAVALRLYIQDQCGLDRTGETTAADLQQQLATAIEADTIVHTLPNPTHDAPLLSRDTEKRILARRIVSLETLLRITKGMVYVIEHTKHERSMRQEQLQAQRARLARAQHHVQTLCAKAGIPVDDDCEAVTADTVVLVLDTVTRRIQAVAFLERWITGTALRCVDMYHRVLSSTQQTLAAVCSEHPAVGSVFAEPGVSLLDAMSSIFRDAGDAVTCPCCGSPLLMQNNDSVLHTCVVGMTDPAKKRHRKMLVRDARTPGQKQTDASVLGTLGEVSRALSQATGLVAMTDALPAAMTAAAPCVATDGLIAEWGLHRLQPHPVTLSQCDLRSTVDATAQRILMFREVAAQCAGKTEEMATLRKELQMQRCELSRGEGHAIDILQTVSVPEDGRWSVPVSLYTDMVAWKTQLAETWAEEGVPLHADWAPGTDDGGGFLVSEAAVAQQQAVQARHTLLSEQLRELQRQEDVGLAQRTMHDKYRQQICRANDASMQLFVDTQQNGQWVQTWIRDRGIIAHLKSRLLQANQREQQQRQFADQASALDAWIDATSTYCCKVDNWLTQLWLHSCALARAARLESSMRVFHEASLVANGAFIELAVQGLSSTINCFLRAIVPDVELTVDLCLSGTGKNAIVGASKKEPAPMLSLTEAMDGERRMRSPSATQAAGTTTKPQVLVCTKMRGVELDMDALSGGQYFALQLASLAACANLTNSRILMLDEALGLMDDAAVSRVLIPLTQLARSQDMLILSIAHNTQTAYFDGMLQFEENADTIQYGRNKKILSVAAEWDTQ